MYSIVSKENDQKNQFFFGRNKIEEIKFYWTAVMAEIVLFF